MTSRKFVCVLTSLFALMLIVSLQVSPAAAIEVFQADTIEPYQADTIPYQAETVRPVQADMIETYPAATVKPYQAETIKPYQAETVKPVQANTIQPYQADTIKPYQADTIKPYQAETIKPFQADTVKPFQADTVKPFQADTVKPVQTKIVLKINSNRASVNGQQKQLDVAPVVVNDRTIVPLRFVSESLGAKVDWDPKTQGITIQMGNNVVKLQVDSQQAYVNGQLVSLDVPPVTMNDRTMVPIRFISEKLNYKVSFNEATQEITIGNDADIQLNSSESVQLDQQTSPQSQPQEETPSSSESGGTPAPTGGPVFDLRDGLMYQDGFWGQNPFIIPGW